jgi:hypothetical protein
VESEFLAFFATVTKDALAAKLASYATKKVAVRATVYGEGIGTPLVSPREGGAGAGAGSRVPTHASATASRRTSAGNGGATSPWGALVLNIDTSRMRESLEALLRTYAPPEAQPAVLAAHGVPPPPPDMGHGSLAAPGGGAGGGGGGGGLPHRRSSSVRFSKENKIWIDVVGYSEACFEALCAVFGLNVDVVTDSLIFQSPKLDLSAGDPEGTRPDQVRALILAHVMHLINPALSPERWWSDWLPSCCRTVLCCGTDGGGGCCRGKRTTCGCGTCCGAAADDDDDDGALSPRSVVAGGSRNALDADSTAAADKWRRLSAAGVTASPGMGIAVSSGGAGGGGTKAWTSVPYTPKPNAAGLDKAKRRSQVAAANDMNRLLMQSGVSSHSKGSLLTPVAASAAGSVGGASGASKASSPRNRRPSAAAVLPKGITHTAAGGGGGSTSSRPLRRLMLASKAQITEAQPDVSMQQVRPWGWWCW